MIVVKHFDAGDLAFEITKPFIQQGGQLVEANFWIVQIHKGSVSWLGSSPLLNQQTKRTAEFQDPEAALVAGVAFAIHCGLTEADADENPV